MQSRSLLAALGLLLVLGCDNDPGKGKSAAKVAEPAPVKETTQVASSPLGSATAATKYAFSNAASKIEFVGAKVTRKHDGAFNVFTGNIEVVEGDGQGSVATAEVAMASVTSDDPKLTAHLKSPDLLDVAKYPKATFVSTAIRTGGEKGATHTVTGNLTLHGVTKSITFPVKARKSADAIDVASEFVINRKDFGIVYPGMPDDLIKDEVLLRLTIHGMQMPR